MSAHPTTDGIDPALLEIIETLEAGELTRRVDQIEVAHLLRALIARSAPEPATKGITHCANCGSDWIDNGINPAWCPYCKQPGEPATRHPDAKRLDALLRESWKLEPFDIPTGGDDADIGWRVVEFRMGKPSEVTLAEVFHDDPRAAIDLAIEGPQPLTKEARQDCYGAALAPISESDGALYAALPLNGVAK